MGRSVSSPYQASVTLFRHIEVQAWEDEDDDGNTVMREPTEDDYAWEFEGLVDWIKEDCKAMWPSFRDHDAWLDREDHVLLQNDHAWIGISEYCGLVSIWIVPRTEDHGYYSTANLCAHWCEQIRAKFTAKFSQLQSLGHASNGEQFFQKVA